MTLNVAIVLILLGGWISGKIFSKIRLPSILGMTIFGVVLSLFNIFEKLHVLNDLAPFLRSLALIIILLRAGLGLRKAALNKIGITAVFMSIIPCLLEGFSLTIIFKLLFGFTFFQAGLLGFILSAVSPAVIVPSMLELKQKGYGVRLYTPSDKYINK